jgi:dihydropteroate synthase
MPLFVPSPLHAGSMTLTFERPVLMGIINTTPDSFSDGGRHVTVEAAVQRGRELVAAGASILDIGGESTRPGSEGVDTDTELSRVIPVVEALIRTDLRVALSVDTSKAEVARRALRAGATIINDVTALSDPDMAPVVAQQQAALIVMHMRGEPRSMQKGEIIYHDLLGEIAMALTRAVESAELAGVPRHRIMVDPGIGFGKTVEHNLSLTRRIGELARTGCAVVYGPSRKSFLGAVTGRDVGDRERATAAACALAVVAGAHVLRAHDVAAVRDAVWMAAAVRDAP